MQKKKKNAWNSVHQFDEKYIDDVACLVLRHLWLRKALNPMGTDYYGNSNYRFLRSAFKITNGQQADRMYENNWIGLQAIDNETTICPTGSEAL